MDGQIADTGFCHMRVGGSVGAGASDQLHLVSCAFPFHVEKIRWSRIMKKIE